MPLRAWSIGSDALFSRSGDHIFTNKTKQLYIRRCDAKNGLWWELSPLAGCTRTLPR
jgi:hypothetical protein